MNETCFALDPTLKQVAWWYNVSYVNRSEEEILADLERRGVSDIKAAWRQRMRVLTTVSIWNTTQYSPQPSEKEETSWIRLSNLWAVHECSSDGNCLFSTLAFILSRYLRFKDRSLGEQDMRSILAACITTENVDMLIDLYQSDSEAIPWLVTVVKHSSINNRVSAMQEVVKTSGWLYQGDEISLSLLTHNLGINVLTIQLFNQDDGSLIQRYICRQLPKSADIIFFLCYSFEHWQAAAFIDTDGTLHPFARYDDLPPTLLSDYQSMCGFSLRGVH